MKTIITSSGIVRNPEKPRVGVVSCHNLESWVFDEINEGIDLTYLDIREEVRQEIIQENKHLDDVKVEEELDNRMQDVEFDGHIILFGDWKKDKNDRYVPDTNGEFAAEYNSDTGNICVEFSRHVVPCEVTSPCYVMADGSGPCGDLDSRGEGPVLAYSLPAEYFRKDETP